MPPNPQPELLKQQGQNPDATADKLSTEPNSQEALQKQAEGQKVTSTKDRLSLGASLTGARLDNLKDTLESMGTVYKEYYDLGQSKKENENVTTMRGLEPAVLVGSVDSTRFAVEWHDAKWYKPYIESSNQILKLYDKKLFDPPTQTWLNELKPALDLFVQLGKLGDKDYARKHKSEIWKLVKAKGTGILYSEKGLFNFVLAFDRLKNVCPKLNDVAKDDFKWDEFSVEAIGLKLGKRKGKINGKEDRFAWMVVKKAEEKKVEDKKPEVDQKTKIPVDPDKEKKIEPVDTQVVKIPEFKTPEFYKYYEIDDPKEFEDTLKPLDEWLTPESQKFLNDPKFWENMGVPASDARRSNIKRHFGSDAERYKDGGITSLVSKIDDLSSNCPNFYSDLKNPKSVEYQKLFSIVMQRLLEYFKNENFDRNMIDNQIFRIMFNYVENDDLDKGYRKNLLTQLTGYCEDMIKFDLGGSARWKELLVEYKEKMKEFETK